MSTDVNIAGQITAQRSLTESEIQVLTQALAVSDNRHFFNGTGSNGTLSVNTDNGRDSRLTPAGQEWRAYRDARNFQTGHNCGVSFAEFIVSIVNLEGLEDLVWNGEFNLSADNGDIPAISRIAITDSIVTRQVAQIVFGNHEIVRE